MADVTEADIDDIIEVFRKQQGKLVEADRAAAEGDTVLIDFQGYKRRRNIRGWLWRGFFSGIRLGPDDSRI